MALYKDGKVYRTLEQQVGYLSEKQNEQEVINEEVSQDIDDLEATVVLLPDKTYVDNADNALQTQINGKTTKGEEIVVLEISTTSGTLSDDDFNLLSLNNVIIKYSSYYLVKILSTVNYYRFACLISSGSHFYLFEIDKSTKAYTITYSKIKVDADGVLNDYSAEIIGKILTVKSDYSSGWETNSPEGSNVKSTSEASGKVLKSDGNGGASWENESGGGIDVVTLTQNATSGTLSASDLTKVLGDNCIIKQLSGNYIWFIKWKDAVVGSVNYTDYYNFGSTYYERIRINKSTGAWTKDGFSLKVYNSNIGSGSATSGQVLIADGSGGASWQNVSGTYENYVEISSSSGTLTQTQINKLAFGDSVIIYKPSSYTTVLQKTLDTSTELRFEKLTADQGIWRITITKSTRAYSTTHTLIRPSSMYSSGEPSGKVLITDGSGSASWQTPSVGSVVSGTNDGTNWTSLTIDGTTKNIPSGGGGGGGISGFNFTFYNGDEMSSPTQFISVYVLGEYNGQFGLHKVQINNSNISVDSQSVATTYDSTLTLTNCIWFYTTVSNNSIWDFRIKGYYPDNTTTLINTLTVLNNNLYKIIFLYDDSYFKGEID